MHRRRILQGAAVTAAAALLPASARAAASAAAGDTDYPLAHWSPASTSNYTASTRPSAYPVQYVIIHVTQETFPSTIGIFQNPAKQVSAHYVVRSADGYVAQCVREKNVAWHAGNWDYNTRSIGIEHEGWVDQPAYFTDAMYEQSALLTASVCDRYGITKDRAHILGHAQVPGTDHTDPGPNWDWVRYIRLVNLYSAKLTRLRGRVRCSAHRCCRGRRLRPRWGAYDTPGREGELTDPWVALAADADPGARLGQLRHAHEVFTTAGRLERPVRPVVGESWRRSVRARVSPDGAALVELGADELGPYRDGHPLAPAMPLIRELMSAYARDGEHLLAVCDAHGRLLWVEGHAVTRRAAGRMNFVEGARWAESAAGTNAPGTAIAVDRPVQVFAAEHFLRPVQKWTCAAAPLHDPHTGRLLGAVDITGGDRLAHPHSLAFVQAVARAAESHLALLAPSCGRGCRTAQRARPGRGAARRGRPQDPARQAAQRDPGDAGPPPRGPGR